MELVSAFSGRRDLSVLHAFFCAVTCCLGKSLSHYLSLHLLFLLFCEKPCSHFWGKAIQIQRLPKKTPRTSALQPICYLSTAQLPKKTQELDDQKRAGSAMDTRPLTSSIFGFDRDWRICRGWTAPSEQNLSFFFFEKRHVEKMTQHFQEPLFFLLGCFLVVAIWLEHVEISRKHPFICGAFKWQRCNFQELFFKHQLNSTRIQVVTIPSINR